MVQRRRAQPAGDYDDDVGLPRQQHRPSGGQQDAAEIGLGSEDASEWFLGELDKHFGRIVRELEDRMIIEFERRGGRNWGML